MGHSALLIGRPRSTYNGRVKGRYQIVLSTRSSPEDAGRPLSIWSRFKALFAGLAILIVAVAILALALILGSIMAAVLWVCLVLVIAGVVVKATWRGVKRGQR